jgi:hypothetical protein
MTSFLLCAAHPTLLNAVISIFYSSAMKSFLLVVIMLARQAVSTGYPTLQWDPDTVEDCVEWYNNDEGESCEYVREYFGVTTEVFHAWNPSLGLDCKPWDWQSYCIVTETKLNATKPTTTTSSLSISFSTTSVATLGPSPTAWTALGCYVEDPEMPILEQNMNPNGDTALTIPKCKNSCYRRAFSFVGVQKGNQCCCGSYVGGEWASNQTSCNMPCTGNKNTFCGGNGFLDVFKAEQNQAPASTTTSTITKGTTTTKGVQTTTTRISSATAS